MISNPSLTDSFLLAQHYLNIRTGRLDQVEFSNLLTSDAVCTLDSEEITEKENVVHFFREKIFSRSTAERKGAFTLNENRVVISIKSSSSGVAAVEEVELCDLTKVEGEWKIARISVKFFSDNALFSRAASI